MRVNSVNVKGLWQSASRMALAELKNIPEFANFNDQSILDLSNMGLTLRSPILVNFYPGVVSNGAAGEDEDEGDLLLKENATPANDGHVSLEEVFDPSDVSEQVWGNAAAVEVDEMKVHYDPMVKAPIENGSEQPIYKATIARMLNTPAYHMSSDRLARVRVFSPKDDSNSLIGVLSSSSIFLRLGSPIAFLFKNNKTASPLVSLALGIVDGYFKHEGTKQGSITKSEFENKLNMIIQYRILDIKRVVDNKEGSNDISLSSIATNIFGEVELRFITPLAFKVDFSNGANFLFQYEDLRPIANEIIMRKAYAISKLPVITDPLLPYKVNGDLIFSLNNETLIDGMNGNDQHQQLTSANRVRAKIKCRIPGCKVSGDIKIEQMRQHIDQHYIKGDLAYGFCGFCGSVGKTRCRIALKFLKDGKAREKKMHVECSCDLMPNIVYWASAKNSTKTSPSTNIPVRCPLCPDRETNSIWKRDVIEHCKREHPLEALTTELTNLYTLSEKEKNHVLAFKFS